ncbi:helix-turn-helix transcriptional regulator [Streptomyces sp. NPDC006668]|uniref:helix-turn-helix domain-containing protein n=1 Tax=Streptomyces sp. NPDC006668 TaxID=3156903 RepID=UPI0033D95982
MTANPAPDEPKTPGWGPTSRHVAANVKRLREARGLSTTRLAAAVEELGQSIPATGITRIEKGQRRVDSDDLVALALALNVAPIALLLPPRWGSDTVELTPTVEVSAQVAWLWAQGEAPAAEAPSNTDDAEDAAYWRQWESYQALSLPPERRGIGTYMGRALGALRNEIDRLTFAVRMENDEQKFDEQVERVRTWIQRLEGEVDQLEAKRRGPKRPASDR